VQANLAAYAATGSLFLRAGLASASAATGDCSSAGRGGGQELDVSLYHDDAVMLAPDGSQAQGAKAISELLTGVISMQVQMTTQIESVIETGDIAVAAEEWTMRLRAPDGTTSDQSGQSIVLFTREHAGWRFLIDAPWGL
jgi:ketosteroid isomerase-like protein